MTDHAREAAEKCYYELYHGDERFTELVPKFEMFVQSAIDAACAERDAVLWRAAEWFAMNSNNASPVPEWVNAAMVLNEPTDNETIDTPEEK